MTMETIRSGRMTLTTHQHAPMTPPPPSGALWRLKWIKILPPINALPTTNSRRITTSARRTYHTNVTILRRIPLTCILKKIQIVSISDAHGSGSEGERGYVMNEILLVISGLEFSFLPIVLVSVRSDRVCSVLPSSAIRLYSLLWVMLCSYM